MTVLEFFKKKKIKPTIKQLCQVGKLANICYKKIYKDLPPQKKQKEKKENFYVSDYPDTFFRWLNAISYSVYKIGYRQTYNKIIREEIKPSKRKRNKKKPE